MAGIMDTILKGLASTDSVKTYQHATRIFVDSNMLRSPKYAFLFYVMFDYDDSEMGLATPASRAAQIGALCKSAQLPKFTIDTQVNNAYNRQNITQKRIKYDPVTLKFHDDSDDIIREFWYDYMSFYYRDSDYQTPIYNQDHKYVDRQKETWGYGLRTQQGVNQPQANYKPLKAIRIYSFYRKRFSEYMLINPTITSFRHGEHTNEGSGLMEHEMTIQYEAVKYSVGYVSPDNFGDSMLLLYDMTPSALSAGSTRSIFGQGGLIQTIDNTITDLSNGNYAAAFLKINRATQTFQGSSIKQVLRDEGLDMINRAVRTGTNPLSTVNAPYVAGSSSIGLGLVAYAAGGVGSVSNNRTGQQNNICPQITLARSTPATIDQASPAIDYRAVSGGQVVAQAYKPVQQKPQFPLLPTITPSVRNGVRSTAIANSISASQVASQNINLNKSNTVVSGAKQGNPAMQVPPKQPVLSDTDPLVIGLTIPATLDELDGETDPDRINKCNAQLQRIMSSTAVQQLLANDYENNKAADILVKNAFTPGFGALTYGSEQAWNAVKETLLTKLEELIPAEVKNTVTEFTQVVEKIKEAFLASGDKKKLLHDLLVELSKFSKNLVIRSAYKNLLDMVALSNDIASLANGDVNEIQNFDIKKYWIV
jgi:hypothetical protein